MLDDFEISKYAYRELFYYCLQYPEKKHKLKNCYGLSSHSYKISTSSDLSDPTAAHAIRAAKLSESCEMIEKTAQSVGGELALYILKNVTEGVPYCGLGIPQGEHQFYNLRRRFYLELARQKGLF